MEKAHAEIRTLAQQRWRLAILLSAAVVVIYFGFILLLAYAKDIAAMKLTEGLSLGILLGALVIVAAWVTTWIYVSWANSHYDNTLTDIKTRHRGQS